MKKNMMDRGDATPGPEKRPVKSDSKGERRLFGRAGTACPLVPSRAAAETADRGLPKWGPSQAPDWSLRILALSSQSTIRCTVLYSNKRSTLYYSVANLVWSLDEAKAMIHRCQMLPSSRCPSLERRKAVSERRWVLLKVAVPSS